jgi:pyruvate-ferredoxin/flavodoxin oxidoreductase
MQKKMTTIDGNTAAAHIAYAFSEVAAIYPITPSSDMGEKADAWAAEGRKNIFGQPVSVVEMQSEAGAAGACHGSLTAGSLTTTFTASQGLLLMIPNMFKIAGEMMPAVFHVSARSVACQSLSIFGDHSDVMSALSTGFCFLSSANVQETLDLATVAHLATLEARIPFIHFFDGFRTSHSVQKVEEIDYNTLASMLDMQYVDRFRKDSLNPDRPYCKVGAQNPDVYFQGRETVNKYYSATPEIVRKYMKLLEEKLGRKYDLFDYIGDPEAEKILISMGSSCETIEETVNYLCSKGEKVGAIKVRLYRPFSVEDFKDAIPSSVKKIAVLDRTKEPGAPGEPLYLDTVMALQDRGIKIIGGRYGLSSKEFTPSMVKAVFDHLDGACTHNFTVGINDDVTHLSLDIREEIDVEPKSAKRCKFWGYGSDGTVSACKNSIKIIGDDTDLYAQGYFQYDSNKSGGFTISHLRFGKEKIQSEYLLNNCDFIACHREQYIGKYDLLQGIVEGGIFLLNSTAEPEKVFSKLTEDMQKTIRDKHVKMYVINAASIAREVGLGNRINTVMQTAFFKISGVIPEDEAIDLIKNAVKKQFLSRGEEIVKMNWKAIDAARDAVQKVPIPEQINEFAPIQAVIPSEDKIPENTRFFAQNVMEHVIRLKGDNIPVSAMSVNGSIPSATNRMVKLGRQANPLPWLARELGLNEDDYSSAYFDFPASCAGCGEIMYISMVTQLFGDRMLIANATGCSSIYGCTFPATPYSMNKEGKGPAWANSLFEDNAEYGFGMRLSITANRKLLKSEIENAINKGTTPELTRALQNAQKLYSDVSKEAKENANLIKTLLPDAIEKATGESRYHLEMIKQLEDFIVEKSVWIFGGDGWAYDIGYGGLDHVLASGLNVNVLVLDTEVYSNTGGQASKATPRGAVAKFAASGKKMGKKNLGLMMTAYGTIYVASINLNQDRKQAAQAIWEAENYNGPSIIIAYSPCIAHGYPLAKGAQQSKLAASTGYWPLYRFNPDLKEEGKNPFIWESLEPTEDFREFTKNEGRYRSLTLADPEEAERLLVLAKKDNEQRFESLKDLVDK